MSVLAGAAPGTGFVTPTFFFSKGAGTLFKAALGSLGRLLDWAHACLPPGLTVWGDSSPSSWLSYVGLSWADWGAWTGNLFFSSRLLRRKETGLCPFSGWYAAQHGGKEAYRDRSRSTCG